MDSLKPPTGYGKISEYENNLRIALMDARYRRKSPCEHGIVQHDSHGEPLPCAFPGCPCGIPGRALYRPVRNPPGSYSEWIACQKTMAGSTEPAFLIQTFVRETVYGVPRFPRGLFLWVDEAVLSAELYREAKRRRLAERDKEKYVPPPTLRDVVLRAAYRGLHSILCALFLERSWPKRRA
jgi:hypothetical protein